MFKSFINPQKIIGNGTKATSPEAFSNFMSGGKAALGSSVSSGAANNISSFARSGVAAAANTNITPLIANISTSITNNVDNSVSNVINSFKSQVQSVLGGVQSNLSATIQNFSKDYQQRIQNKEDNKPSNILKGFLGLYQNAINFVTFFGDSKNNKKIEFTLKSLRNMFSDSFNTAAIIRQTIVKIVKQLSNLPTASGASGGLNLDVKVPGGALKQSGRATLSKFAGSRGGKLFGAGVVGAGAVGLGMMGMQSAKASQEEKLAETAKKGVGGEDKPNDFMKGLNSIAERFSDAIDSLLGRSKKPPGGGGASSSGSGAAAAGAAGAGAAGAAGPPGGNVNAGDITADTAEEKAFIATVRETEGTAGVEGYNKFFGGSQYGGDLSTKTANEVAQLQKKFLAEGKGTFSGGSSAAVGAGQFMKPEEVVRAMGLDPAKEKFTPELQNKMILYLAKTTRKVDVSKPLTIEGIRTLNEEWSGFGPRYRQNNRTLQQTKQIYEQNLKEAKSEMKGGSVVPPPSTKVKPAPASTSTIEPAPPTQKAQEVSQAVTAPPGQETNANAQVATIQLQPEVSVIPGGGSQDGGGAVASLPAPSFAGPNVSGFGDTKNEDNPYWFISQMLGVTA